MIDKFIMISLTFSVVVALSSFFMGIFLPEEKPAKK